MKASKIQMDVIDEFDRDIRNLARTKAFLVKTHVFTEEEAIEFLNERGERYAEKYDAMKANDILVDLLIEGIANSMKGALDVQD